MSGELLFLKAEGQYLNFDDRGTAYLPLDDIRNAMEVMSKADEIARERLQNPKVTSIRLHKQAKELISENTWAVSREELEPIEFDLMGRLRPAGTSAIPVLKTYQGLFPDVFDPRCHPFAHEQR